MAKKGNYDWGDGKGKVHSRPKRTKQVVAKERAAADPTYAIALAMAEQAFAPAIRQVRNQAIATQQQGMAGGALDVAFDRQGANIAASQKAAQDFSTGLTENSKAFGEGIVGSLQQLGAENVAQAQAAQKTFGRTAEAATQAASTSNAQVLSQLGQAKNATGTLAALGQIQQGAGVGYTAANEARRGEGRNALQSNFTKLVGDLADLRAKRGQTAQTTATQMAKDERDFRLAEASLKQRDTDSLRDYRTTMAGIAQQNKQLGVTDENADLDREQESTIARLARENGVTIKQMEIEAQAAEDRRRRNEVTPLDLARFDVNKNGRLDPGEAVGLSGTGGTGKQGGATVYVDRDGKGFHTTAAGRTDFVNRRNQIRSMLSALGDGRLKSGKDLERVTGLDHLDERMFDFIIDYKARLNSPDANTKKYPIQRKWGDLLRAYFKMEGKLPADLSNQMVPAGKKK